MTEEEYKCLVNAREVVNKQMFTWIKEDQEKFQEGKATIRVLCHLIREYRKTI